MNKKGEKLLLKKIPKDSNSVKCKICKKRIKSEKEIIFCKLIKLV